MPDVKLGRTAPNGICPSMLGLIERGLHLRPELAAGLEGDVVIRFAEDFAPVHVRFGPRTILVEDGDMRDPDLVISGTLVEVVQLTTASLPGALKRIAAGRVGIQGSPLLARRLLKLLAI